MKNCFVRGYKAAVENESLEVLGFTKIIVDTTGQTGNTGITGYGGIMPVGTYIVGEGTFVNGKKVIDPGDISQVAPNQVITLMAPKYEKPVRIGSASIINGKGVFAMDFDGYAYQDKSAIQPSTDYVGEFNLYPTPNGYEVTGNLDNYIWQPNPELITTMQISGMSKMLFDLVESPNLYRFKKLTTLRIQLCNQVTGDLQAFISKFAQANKEYLKTRTNYLSLFTGNCPKLTYGQILSQAQNVGIIRLFFSGGSTVDVRSTSDGGTTYSTFATYDIDTDTFTLV